MYGGTFEDGYIFVNAKREETDTIITLSALTNALEGTDTTLEVLDEEGNALDLTNEEVLSGEVKNNYVIKFTNGITASYKVIVKGDTNLDNILDKEDLSGVMEGYLDGENMPSMDMVTLEKEVTVEGQEEPEIVKEEFGTITFEDVMFTNELLKENGNTEKEELDNTGLGLSFGEVISENTEIYVGDTFELDVLVNSEDVLDYIDGINLLMVNPGFAGQKIVPSTLRKAERIQEFLKEQKREHITIEVDGNITFENGAKLRKSGASVFVCGSSSIFKGNVENYRENIRKFREMTE